MCEFAELAAVPKMKRGGWGFCTMLVDVGPVEFRSWLFGWRVVLYLHLWHECLLIETFLFQSTARNKHGLETY